VNRDEALTFIKASRAEMEEMVKAALLKEFHECLRRAVDEEVHEFLHGTGEKPKGVLP